MTLFIKNMVCPRCIAAVKQLLDDLNLQPGEVNLGEAFIKSPLNETKKAVLKDNLELMGFELLEDGNTQTADKIKSVIIEAVQRADGSHIIFSDLISSRLNKEYSSLSKLFSSTENITIEQFIILQKIEKVKELLSYNEFTLSEIAYLLGYSSVAHLSGQFRRITTLSPTAYRASKQTARKGLDSVTKKV